VLKRLLGDQIDAEPYRLGPDSDSQTLAEPIRRERVQAASFEFFIAYPSVLMVNDSSIFKAMRVARKGGGIVCVHADDGTVIDVLVREALDYGYTSSPSWYRSIDPVRGGGDAARDHGGARANSHVGCLSASDALAYNRRILTNAMRCPPYLFLGISKCDLPRFHEVGRSATTKLLKELRPKSAAWRRVTDDQLSPAQQLAVADGFHKIPNGALGLDTRSIG